MNNDMFNKGGTSAGASSAAPGNNQQQAAGQAKAPAVNQMKKFQEETMDNVLSQIQNLQELGDLKLPDSYAVGNQLKLAWLHLIELKDKNDKPALEVCTKDSICNTLLKMCVEGMSVSKSQCAFIVYGNQLTYQREYHGTIALANRLGGVIGVPAANIIYEGDVFEYSINNETGIKSVLKHEQKFENIDNTKIKGAYAIVQFEDRPPHIEIMTLDQIRKAWMMGKGKGDTPAHKNFPDMMAKKTIIGRACNLFITTSDDSELMASENVISKETGTKPEKKKLNAGRDIQDVNAVDVTEQEKTPPAGNNEKQTPEPPQTAGDNETEGPGF